MKKIFKKSIIAMLMLAMLVQMTGSAFAASVYWTSSNQNYSAYVNKSGDAVYKYALYSSTSVQHTKGKSTVVTVNVGSTTYISGGPTSFGTNYDTYLFQCMNNEELYSSKTIIFSSAEPYVYTISANEVTGTYCAAAKVTGYAGTWGVLVAESQESTMNHIESGNFNWAPSTHLNIPVIGQVN